MLKKYKLSDHFSFWGIQRLNSSISNYPTSNFPRQQLPIAPLWDDAMIKIELNTIGLNVEDAKSPLFKGQPPFIGRIPIISAGFLLGSASVAWKEKKEGEICGRWPKGLYSASWEDRLCTAKALNFPSYFLEQMSNNYNVSALNLRYIA